MDALGHVNSSKYFSYFESARIKYYVNLGLLDFFKLNKIAGILSITYCTYFIPLTYTDNLTVGTSVADFLKNA